MSSIREIVQQTALLGLQRHGFFEKAAFNGGTALRILYGLDRFSEDLDFSLLQPKEKFDFSPFFEGIRKELKAFGFELEVFQKLKNGETDAASKMNTLKFHLSIGEENGSKRLAPNEKIQIKLEVNTQPCVSFRVQNKLVLDPVSFYVLTLHAGDLFAGKMYEILFKTAKGRVRGTDWYDLVWYIQNKIPINLTCLTSFMKQDGCLPMTSDNLNKEQLIQLLAYKIEKVNWADAKADMHSFIADPDKVKNWSPQYFKEIIQFIKVE